MRVARILIRFNKFLGIMNLVHEGIKYIRQMFVCIGSVFMKMVSMREMKGEEGSFSIFGL